MPRATRLAGRVARDERGFTLIELVTVLGMLMIVVTALSGVLVSATNIEADLNRRFGSQINARIALDQLRREIHCASSVAPLAPGVTWPATGVTIVLGNRCPTVGGGATVSWCTVSAGTHFALYRSVGATCDSTGRRSVEYLTNATVFSFTPQSTNNLAYLSVDIRVNAKPASGLPDYKLTDDIVLRNSTRT